MNFLSILWGISFKEEENKNTVEYFSASFFYFFDLQWGQIGGIRRWFCAVPALDM